MPTYQYECELCSHTFDILQSMLDKKLKKCPQCGKNKLYRLIGAGSGIIFKGSGFYETDYKKKDDPTRPEPKKDLKESTSKASESKVESKESSGGVERKQKNQPA